MGHIVQFPKGPNNQNTVKKMILTYKNLKYYTYFTDLKGSKEKYNLHLDEAVLTSTHNQCFESKIGKIGIPLQTLVFSI